MKKNLVLAYCFSLLASIVSSQNVGIGTLSPDNSASLEVQSTNKGVLVPRIALTAANVASPVTSPADALLIYNTATAGAGTNAVIPGFYYWNAGASRWNTITRTSSNGSSGFGTWGDCSFNSVSEYNPVADDTGESGDQFGTSVSISGSYAIIGAMQDNETFGNQGSVSFYHFDGSQWVFKQKITDDPGEGSAYYGISVSISGNYAIVGAIYDGPFSEGSASIYQYIGTSWVFMQKVTDSNPLLQAYFGVSVSISGNYAIVGAYADDVGQGSTQGSASIFHYNGTNWVLMQEIVDATGFPGDWFGGSVSISDNYVIVGAERDDVGSNSDQGSASIYKYDGANWVLMQKIVDPSGGPSDYFGYSVAIAGDHAMVGAIWDDIGSNTNQGSATIYQKVGAGWQKMQYLADPAGNADQLFGASLAMDNSTDRFAVGAVGYLGIGKVVFGKTN